MKSGPGDKQIISGKCCLSTAEIIFKNQTKRGNRSNSLSRSSRLNRCNSAAARPYPDKNIFCLTVAGKCGNKNEKGV